MASRIPLYVAIASAAPARVASTATSPSRASRVPASARWPSSPKAMCAWPTGSSEVDHVSADGLEDLADLRLRPDRAEQTGRGANDGDGHAAQRVLGER